MVDLNDSIWNTHQSPSDRSGAEDTQAKEARSRRKLQKSQSEHPRAFKLANGNPSDNSEAQLKGTTRRRPSFRHPKAPMGARPLTRSPSKSTSNVEDPSRSNRSTSFGLNTASRSRQMIVTNTPQQHSLRQAPGDVFGRADDGQSVPFLPEVNFDDLHTSITGEPNLYDLAASRAGFGEVPTASLSKQVVKETTTPSLRTAEKKDPAESRLVRSNSLLRKQSSVAPKSQLASKAGGPANADNSTGAKARRQSHFPSSASSNSIPRAPRKSIGPGVLAHSASDYSFLRRDVPRNVSQGTYGPNGGAEASLADTPYRDSEDVSLSVNPTGKYKLSQTPKRGEAETLHTSPSTPDNPWAGLSSSSSRSPLRYSQVDATTPTSAKRLSVVPGHATGLGARTISPTDARRMKRMSMMPNAPPMPSTPPMAMPDPSAVESKLAAEPSTHIPRKVETPSSIRTTPDPNRKSVGSAVSISSNTSLNSFRTHLNGSARAYQSIASSRLPTLKGRNEPNASGSDEGVPPVPAIPKAYESPKNELDISFNVARKSSLQFDAGSTASASTNEFASVASTNSSEKDSGKSERHLKPRKSFTLDSDMPEDRASGAQNGRRTLQPIRLPPLNLLPLSTPTADKIAALGGIDAAAPEGHAPTTPPPKRGVPQTPSTPMTASKANFTRFLPREDSSLLPAHLRTSSSHYNLKSDVGNSRIPSGSVANLPAPIDFRPPRKAVSPFLSSSLPKSSGEFSSTRAKPIGDRSISTFGVDFKPIRPSGPRAQTGGKASKADPVDSSGALTDTETNSFSSSLRRKLSLTRKRSGSKADMERPPQPPDHEVMPPPKLPASATWTGPWNANANEAPAQRPTYLHSRRKSTLAEGAPKHDRSRSDVAAANAAAVEGNAVRSEGQRPAQIRNASNSIPATSKLYLTGRQRATGMQAIDTELDKDDLIAEEEMKRLAHKRKSAENAAKELDELRHRAVPKDCVTPLQALRAARLNIFERGEIMDFKEIYFCGTQNANKVEGNAQAAASNNFGYDDERGDYNIVLGDHLEYRYEVVDILGKGSFGQVVRCIDHKSGHLVAIKIIRNKKRFHQQALVEVNILQKLREWDPENKFSMVNFTAQFYFRGHLCIATELLGMNLYEFIKLHDFRGFSLKLIRRFTKQMLNSLVLLHSRKIIHCDLKPENVLLAHPAHSEIKVIDFGSSCHENERVYTYIQSRFYRSPEVILGMTYGMPIDMWSLGCILAELLTGYPIFPGENEQEQLACIMEVFGPPDKQLIEKATRKKLFFDSMGKPRLTVSSKGKRRRPSSKTLQQALKCDDEPFLDFLTKCLRWDPERRLKPEEAVQHEFITGIKQAPIRTLRPLPQSTAGVSTSPIKRFNSLHTPSSAVRPLPDPPATVLRNGINPKPREGLNVSPTKQAAKRHSTVAGLANGIGAGARKGSGNVLGSGHVPRLEGRVAAGGGAGRGTDLASAAAAAAATVSSLHTKASIWRRKSVALIVEQKSR